MTEPDPRRAVGVGVLAGIRVIELSGLGPAPFCAMMLADHGADVLRVTRPSFDEAPPSEVGLRDGLAAWDVLNRSRWTAGIDLRNPGGAELVLELCASADVLVEGFRPGVAERLGVGPDAVRAVNPRLVYGRMTGWGRSGPLAERAGHDLNYVSVAGVQAHVGRADSPPTPPLNLVGDFGGGGMLLAFGVCAALVRRSISGYGQVVDAAMVDGAALLMAPLFGAHGSGFWSDERGTNLLDSGAPFYDCYRCADDRWLSVAAIEPEFFGALLQGLGLAADDVPPQMDRTRWVEMRALFESTIASRSRDAWMERFEGLDACVAPVLMMGEAPSHPQHRARETFVEVAGVVQPGPAPRFGTDPAPTPRPATRPGGTTAAALAAWGIGRDRTDALRASGVIGD
ncbi:MAG: CaiB/BaiF CoA-transferase family protein [Microthrixaceae bacterium]